MKLILDNFYQLYDNIDKHTGMECRGFVFIEACPE